MRRPRGQGAGATVEVPDARQTTTAGRGVAVGTSGDSDYPETAPDALRGIQSLFRQSERSFQSQVVRYAELMGWRTYHTHDSRRSGAGFPDLVLVRRPRIVWAELKAERGRLSEPQKVWLADLRACEQEVFLWRPSSWKEIERVLR